MKHCPVCHVDLPLTSFAKDKRSKDGLQYRCRACMAAYRRSPSGRTSEANRRARRLRDPEYVAQNRANTRSWQRRFPQKVAAKSAQRRAAKMAATTDGDVTAADLYRIGDRLDWRCAYCNMAPIEHWDHVVPLARGGSHTVENITGACAPCNLSKHARLLEAWLPGHLDRLEADRLSA